MQLGVPAELLDGPGADDATLTFSDVLPEIIVEKTADPTTLPEPGGEVTYTIVVTNESVEPVALTSVTDDRFGNLTTDGHDGVQSTDCALGAIIPMSNAYECTFTALVAENAFDGDADGDGQLDPAESWSFTCTATLTRTTTNVGTATGTDDDGRQVSATDTATITVVVPAAVERGRSLARTGAELLRIAVLGGGLLLVGSGIVRLANRRRRGSL